MQTRTYGDLFKLIQSLAGVRAFAPSEQDDIANLINRRFSEIYNESPIWPRYVVPSEPRLGTLSQIIPYTQNSYVITNAGVSKANGLYEQGMSSDLSDAYTLNGSQIRFTISGFTGSDEDANGEYQFNYATSLSGGSGSMENGEWVNTKTPGYRIRRYLFSDWAGPTGDFWELSSPSSSVIATAPNKTLYPWLATWSLGTFSGPDETYNLSNGGVISENTLSAPAVSSGETEKSISLYTAGSGFGKAINFSDYSQNNGLLPTPSSTYTQDIGDFIRIHRTEPFLNNSALEYDFYVSFDGAHVMNVVASIEGVYYVTYKAPFVPFSVTSDYTNSAVEVPLEFFHYLAHSTYADFLRMDGQTDKAFAEEQKAATYMALELERIDTRSNNNSLNQRFSTYVNKQSR